MYNNDFSGRIPTSIKPTLQNLFLHNNPHLIIPGRIKRKAFNFYSSEKIQHFVKRLKQCYNEIDNEDCKKQSKEYAQQIITYA
eukprot:UN26779